jgi:polysaccharide export outer membrane protein
VNFTKYLIGLLCACALTACASKYASEGFVSADDPTAVSADRVAPDGGSEAAPASAHAAAGRSADPRAAVAAAGGTDGYATKDAQTTARLEALFRQRTRGEAVTDYPIGPGDVLDISVPPIDELKKRTVRVEADGTISLPMLGTLKASGLTEEQLRAELHDKLKTYMYNPEVEVFVKEYHSREVAVVGAVNTPGLITLNGPNETVLDMLTRAGGLNSTAADELILLPAEYNSQPAAGRIAQVSAEAPAPADGLRQGAAAAARSRAAFQQREVGALLRQNSHPLIIGLKSTALTGSGGYLNMPVRPGDVIVVPGGGEVMVVGWVQNPGHFQVGSGLTVLGAIGAAGGPMYAADTSEVHLIRTRRDGSKLVLKIDLSKIKSGSEPDLPVRGNDVIDVPYSDLKIGPYVFYQILTKMYVGGPSIPMP